MARIVWALGAIVTAAVAALAMSASSPEGAAEAAQARPNVVLIMTDDQTVEDMSVLPPHAARVLGTRGTTFRNSFVVLSALLPLARHDAQPGATATTTA